MNVHFFSGGTPLTINRSYYDGNIPFIRSAEISGDITELTISEDGLNNSSAKMVQKGDLLYALYGATSGEVSICKIDGAINQAILCIKSDNLDLPFLEKILRKNKENIINTYLQGGQGNLSSNIVKGLKYNIPLKEEQEKIASFFSLIDDKISLQGEKVEALKDYKKGMMQKIFSRKLRFEGFSNEWKKCKAKDLFCSISDKNHNGELEVLSATQDRGVIPRSELNIDIKFEKDNLTSYKKVNKSDFIISLRSFQGGIEHSGYIGLVSPAYTVFNFKEGIDFNHDFFAIIFKSRDFINRLNTLTYGIRDGKAISFKDFSDVKLEFPSVEEQNKIAAFFLSIDKKIDKEQEKLDYLNEYKKGLLQQMFI